MHRVLLAVLLGCVIFVNWCYADTTWVNTGAVSGVWTAEHSPYMIQGYISVTAGHSLQIDPGVSVVWRANYGLTVYGRLTASGSEQDSIHFRSTATHLWTGITISLTADPAVFDYCTFDFDEDGLTASNANLTIQHSALRGVSGNYALIVSGSDRSLIMSDCVVEHNRQYMYSAGLSLSGVNATLTNCLIRDNGNGTYAGGLNIRFNCDVMMVDCIVSGNRGGKGGGITVGSGSRLTMMECVVSGDTAYLGYGGGIYVDANGRLNMSDCMILGNVVDGNLSSQEGGAGIAGVAYAGSPAGRIRLTRCLLSDNHLMRTGSQAQGGAIWGGDSVYIDHCTITENRAASGSAIGYVSNLILKNSIVADNPVEILNSAEITGRARSVTYSDFHAVGHRVYNGSSLPGFQTLSQENANGDSCDQFYNLFRDPLFVDRATGNFHLTAESPCIDAGDPASPLDPDQTLADLGAFPYTAPSAVKPESPAVPQSLVLSAYPNPFNAGVMLDYTLERAGKTQLTVYDLLGREAAVLASAILQPGRHQQLWNAAGMPSGVYVAVLKNGGHACLQKLVLLK